MTPQEVLDWAGTVLAVIFMVVLTVFMTIAVVSYVVSDWKDNQ